MLLEINLNLPPGTMRTVRQLDAMPTPQEAMRHARNAMSATKQKLRVISAINNQDRLLEYIKANPRTSQKQAIQDLKMPWKAAKDATKELVIKGMIIRPNSLGYVAVEGSK